MTVPQYMRYTSPMRGEEPYFVRNWHEFLQSENLTDDPDEALEKNEGWSRLIEEARKRIGDFDSDEETILYSLCYEHFKPEMMIINKAYYEILSEGDAIGQPFTFPIPTVNITEDFDWDDPQYDFLFENAALYGSSYFQNFIGSQFLRDENGNLTIRDENAYSPNDVRSMCCRLQLDRKALRKRGGGLFGSDSRTGSIGVVTINMARLGYLYKGDLKALYKRLGQLMDMARSTLDKKRVFVEEMYARGLYPYTRRYIPSYDTFFSTIGVNGMNEMVRNFTNDEFDITDERGQKMCLEILKWMNEKLVKYQEEGKALWNLEATPAEGTTTRFAREDIKRYPEIIQAGFEGATYYTNSSQLPVDFSTDVFSTLDLQDDLQKSYTGGTVFHIYNDEDVTKEECKLLLKKVLSNYRLPYVSFTATFSTCPKHGRISGIHEYCPLCDKELMRKHADEIDPNKA
jgi:ribonucleoside-triphosphate reductase